LSGRARPLGAVRPRVAAPRPEGLRALPAMGYDSRRDSGSPPMPVEM
jgi:hypothetical protein